MNMQLIKKHQELGITIQECKTQEEIENTYFIMRQACFFGHDYHFMPNSGGKQRPQFQDVIL